VLEKSDIEFRQRHKHGNSKKQPSKSRHRIRRFSGCILQENSTEKAVGKLAPDILTWCKNPQAFSALPVHLQRFN
jgi:hypothetical protein